MKEGRNIKIIEWNDLNKHKFYMNGIAFFGTLRFMVYPINLVKTRLQAQHNQAYKGLRDAFKQILHKEGLRGLYKGFPISMVQIIAGQFYITTYESSKQSPALSNLNSTAIQHCCAGLAASLVSQTIMVPVDVISQHQQVLGAEQKFSTVCIKDNKSSMGSMAAAAKPKYQLPQSYYIIRHILQTEGVQGLYRGYLISMSFYGSNSAMYWASYYLYSELYEDLLPSSSKLSVLREQCRILLAGFSASITACVLSNPLDVVRTRYQLQVKSSTGERATARDAYRSLIASEGYSGLTRGLTARITQSSITSSLVILGYEYVKKTSLKDDVQL